MDAISLSKARASKAVYEQKCLGIKESIEHIIDRRQKLYMRQDVTEQLKANGLIITRDDLSTPIIKGNPEIYLPTDGLREEDQQLRSELSRASAEFLRTKLQVRRAQKRVNAILAEIWIKKL